MSCPHLVVPGWEDSGPEHWQTLWSPELAAARVHLDDWVAPRLDAWVTALDAALAALARRDPRPPVLVAHSLGCISIAHWARTHRRPIRAALLVAPADVERPTCLPVTHDFAPVPSQRLSFPSLVVASDDDPYITVERAKTFADAWGGELRVIHNAGHINTSSGLGLWPEGRALLAMLVRQTEPVQPTAPLV